MTKHYDFFQHRECEYFPCHKNANPETFSCLFCYCPLYALGDKCGGNFSYNEKGVKDCSNCLIPHQRKNYDYITNKVMYLIEKVKDEHIAEQALKEKADKSALNSHNSGL